LLLLLPLVLEVLFCLQWLLPWSALYHLACLLIVCLLITSITIYLLLVLLVWLLADSLLTAVQVLDVLQFDFCHPLPAFHIFCFLAAAATPVLLL
jgi:hypothetical protein